MVQPIRRIWNGFAVVVCAVLLASCASSTTALAPTPTNPTNYSTATPRRPLGSPTATLPPFAMLTPLSLQAAWGNVPIHTYSTDVGNGWEFIGWDQCTPDGRYLIGTYAPRSYKSTVPWYVALFDIQTKQVIRIHASLASTSKGTTIVADEHWVVWMDATDPPQFDWHIFAYNRQSGQTQQIAQATRINGAPVQGPPPSPYIDHGLVVWGQALSPNHADFVAYLYNLATGDKQTLATNAGSPQISWPWVMWDQALPTGGGYEQFQNLQTGQKARLDEIAISVAIAGNSVAYVNADYTVVKLLPDITQDTSHPTILDEGNPTHVEFVSMNARLIVWLRDITLPAIAYDRLLHQYIKLPPPRSGATGGIWITGPYLVWSDDVSAAQHQQDSAAQQNSIYPFYLIDSRTLPTVSP